MSIRKPRDLQCLKAVFIVDGYIRRINHSGQNVDAISDVTIDFYFIHKKHNLNEIDDQIEILFSESARKKSLFLCSKTEYYIPSGAVQQVQRNYSFIRFLETSLSPKVVDQLFNKFKSESNDAKKFVALLTLVVIIYNVKLHKLRTGSSNKPKLDTQKMKQSVEHLAAWIIRTYGTKTLHKKTIWIINDSQQLIEDDFYIYTFNPTKTAFASDIKKWVEKYVNDDGMYIEYKEMDIAKPTEFEEKDNLVVLDEDDTENSSECIHETGMTQIINNKQKKKETKQGKKKSFWERLFEDIQCFPS